MHAIKLTGGMAMQFRILTQMLDWQRRVHKKNSDDADFQCGQAPGRDGDGTVAFNGQTSSVECHCHHLIS